MVSLLQIEVKGGFDGCKFDLGLPALFEFDRDVGGEIVLPRGHRSRGGEAVAVDAGPGEVGHL